MSKLGKKPILIPSGVQINIEGDMISVKGPKGTLSQRLSPYIKVAIEENKLWVQQNEESIVRRSQRKMLRTFQGTYWSLIKNMITGVTEGFEKQLEIVGVGYRAQLQGNKVSLQLGYTHPIVLEPPVGVSVEVPAPNVVVVKGIDKQKVGQFAAEVRSWRKVNVYSGKGVKYRNEVVKLKEGKKA
ncbi:50S ribosomal protein L6 [Pseudothermotoga lettingae]|jgi:large subunit ribosomal protein L6|uniref:Large ribosomal subunit protein uL6 n=2 Tax=Pseudothermotoga TaxID=1643951 RepID=RL6_PSELT|nr:50S ribosomal protein L6 [Pseudothermotoga lettingae]A8F4S6.1 RecName: Full=Large ribosomal subunit protein uL6; AltName: Full=50S ribosomal protein L6 [Pseudothermotoga lettingae TMO]ABV33160.1 ribosomal protein L6 [Pseudothermotoga lettingae TMO]GLI47838.1 50S ribosomal protein L6 [Pseudothermotoga lettingae TMO]